MADLLTRLIQTFKNPKPELMALLRESGPVPGDENGAKAGKADAAKKKKSNKTVRSRNGLAWMVVLALIVLRSTWRSSPTGCRS